MTADNLNMGYCLSYREELVRFWLRFMRLICKGVFFRYRWDNSKSRFQINLQRLRRPSSVVSNESEHKPEPRSGCIAKVDKYIQPMVMYAYFQ